MYKQTKIEIGNLIRALRLPFIAASILPFIFGSLLSNSCFNWFTFFLGLLAVTATHLGANLLNDYADSKSGVDWVDKKFFGFFGGSKLIQEGILSEEFYFKSAVICFIVAIISILSLTLILKDFTVVWCYSVIIFLGWAYSCKPLQLSYRRWGELVVFILFGPALVMGGYFLQTQIFLSSKSFILSLPFAFLTTAILFANEIPDYQQDSQNKKLNLVSIFGLDKSYLVYLVLIIDAFAAILLGIIFGYLNFVALFSLTMILPALKAADILKKDCFDKMKLINSSKLTIMVQTVVSIILIVSLLL